MRYNTDSALRTIEILFGMPPMNQYDAGAAPLDVFGKAAGNDAPFQARLPAHQIIAGVNTARAYRARDSTRLLNPLQEESAPDEELNDIVWHTVRGRNVPAPPRRYSLRLEDETRRRD